MKKIFSILIVSVIFFPKNVLADWSNSKYFQCFVTKRYTARAKLKPPGQNFYSWTYDGGCGYASTNISSFAVNSTSNCGYAESYRNSGGGSGNGWSSCGWQHGTDTDLLPPFFDFTPMKANGVAKSENDENYTYSGLADDGIHFNKENRKISIINLKGKLAVHSSDIHNSYSTVQIEIYTFRINDGKPIKENSLWKAKATIINGKLFVEGEFYKSDFKNMTTADSSIYLIEGISKEYTLPENIKLENVCIKVSGDGGNFGRGISSEYSPNLNSEEGRIFIKELKSEITFDFKILMQENFVTALITKNSSKKLINEVYIVSLSGQKVLTKKINKDDLRLNIDISTIPSGIYLYMIKSGNEYYSKKFIKK